MLILYSPNKIASLKELVWLQMLDFLLESIPDAEKYEYFDDQALTHKIDEGAHTTVVVTGCIEKKTSFLLRGMEVVQVVIGRNDAVVDLVDIVIDPLEKHSERFFYGLNFLLPSLVQGTMGERIAEYLGLSVAELCRQVDHNVADENICDIVRLIQELKWDSEFFGNNIAYLSCLRLTPNIEKRARDFVRKKRIDLLEYRCNCHDHLSVETAEQNGYSFVDIRLTLEQRLTESRSLKLRDGFSIRKAVERDIKILQECGHDIYRLSRYYYDPNFDPEKVNEFYSSWINKAVLGLFDDYCYVLCDKDLPIGFCTIKEYHVQSARIGLVGLDQNYNNSGLGSYMLEQVLENLRINNINYVEVVTQGRNYAAQRLYQRCGFITKNTELWYHKWLR